MIDMLNNFELSILERLSMNYPLIKNHIPFLKVESRESTGAGMYINFIYDNYHNEELNINDSTISTNEVIKIDMSSIGESLHRAITAIESNTYDYVFIDMPGTLYQEGTSELLGLIEHLIIPVDISFFSEDSAEEFIHILNELELSQRFKTLKFVSNKYKILQVKQNDLVERELTTKTKISFMKTRIKHASIFESRAYNTIIPINYRINLNTGKITHNERQSNIGDFAIELMKIIDEK